MADTPSARPNTKSRQAAAISAVEGLVHAFLCGLSDARGQRTSQMLPSADHRMSVSTDVDVSLCDPDHAVVVEDGGFQSGTFRKSRLRLVRKNYRRLARLLGALDAVHRLNVLGRVATQRELFYRATAEAPNLFRQQTNMNEAILDAVGALQIGRPHLGVMTTERGLVAGAINFSISGTFAVGAASSVTGVAISEEMLCMDDCCIELKHAHCVLVVEKDTFFQHLLQGRLLASLPLVLVTGRGFPDVLTRRFLQRLRRLAPLLPHVYLGDYDPHGVLIFLKYRASCPSIRWLGMHLADVRDLPLEASLPLTQRDRALQASLLQHPSVVDDEDLTQQVRSMSQKFELEALHATHGADAIARDFVPQKILRRDWL
eukprot:TRINITY_DN62900_c0_g1_i1.p1 TRINITY_DN62900_c0_g1~~TRINITY_DN62900_c0_g1_i1.p1  ORF type:complete len:373 (-),score=34.25 TRINITY_DN62900_c0_g1_i1:122-1240(-)